jgi:hypothetical protein
MQDVRRLQDGPDNDDDATANHVLLSAARLEGTARPIRGSGCERATSVLGSVAVYRLALTSAPNHRIARTTASPLPSSQRDDSGSEIAATRISSARQCTITPLSVRSRRSFTERLLAGEDVDPAGAPPPSEADEQGADFEVSG